jgi:hypothetical protein
VFFRVLLVGFSLFRPGAVRAPLIIVVVELTNIYKIGERSRIKYIIN